MTREPFIRGSISVGGVNVRTEDHEDRPMQIAVTLLRPNAEYDDVLRMDREDAEDLLDALRRILPERSSPTIL